MLGGIGVGGSEHEDSGSKEEDTWEDNEGECKEGESEGRREWEHARVCQELKVRLSSLLHKVSPLLALLT